jgi:hypothetical protein
MLVHLDESEQVPTVDLRFRTSRKIGDLVGT